jgi:hypothetical protein
MGIEIFWIGYQTTVKTLLNSTTFQAVKTSTTSWSLAIAPTPIFFLVTQPTSQFTLITPTNGPFHFEVSLVWFCLLWFVMLSTTL